MVAFSLWDGTISPFLLLARRMPPPANFLENFKFRVKRCRFGNIFDRFAGT
jgi:hypothetical protein